MQNIIDKITEKLVSRKLMVFGISVVALFSDKISGDNWIVISTAYIGTEAVVSIVERLIRNKNSQNNG
jgi:uncharacterized membrane protein YjjP (DUF1212 family)